MAIPNLYWFVWGIDLIGMFISSFSTNSSVKEMEGSIRSKIVVWLGNRLYFLYLKWIVGFVWVLWADWLKIKWAREEEGG
jgi:hypothetical protein